MSPELIVAAFIGAALGALLASALWFFGTTLWLRREVHSWRARQDAHEQETQRWMAHWAARSSGMPVEQWEHVLSALQEEAHRRAGLRWDQAGVPGPVREG